MARYTEAGGPAPTGHWDATTQAAGWNAVLAIAAIGPGYLPPSSGDSRPLFEHLVDDRVLTAIKASGGKPTSRLGALSALMMATQGGLKAMVLGATANEVERDALAMVYAHVIAIFAAIAPLVDPFLATFAADDPTLPIRRRGLAKMKTSMATKTECALNILASSETPAAARTSLLTALTTHVPMLALTLPPDLRAAISEAVTKTSQAVGGDLAGPMRALAATLVSVATPPDGP